MLTLIAKLVGTVCVIVGGILTFSLLLIGTKNSNVFLTCLLGGPVLIYLGLKLLHYI